MRRHSGKLKKEGSPHRPFVMCTKFSKGMPDGWGLKYDSISASLEMSSSSGMGLRERWPLLGTKNTGIVSTLERCRRALEDTAGSCSSPVWCCRSSSPSLFPIPSPRLESKFSWDTASDRCSPGPTLRLPFSKAAFSISDWVRFFGDDRFVGERGGAVLLLRSGIGAPCCPPLSEELDPPLHIGNPSAVRVLASSNKKSIMRPVSFKFSHSRKSSSTLIFADGRSLRLRGPIFKVAVSIVLLWTEVLQ
mmetsp:Transcript_16813/g.31575  ORF Transcript_16813/g.31575 Transcript_16813/m.31575 type:complete len:248 (-) Transcript_16813:239-982(-)